MVVEVWQSSGWKTVVESNKNKEVSPFAVNATAGGGSYQLNGKYPALTYPLLGGASIANYAMGTSTDLKNPTEYKFGACSLFDLD